MANAFQKIAFTDSVKEIQNLMGSRKTYARWESGLTENEALTADEVRFISERDTFYMSTVTETDWPYVQHRGGPKGFLKVLSEREIGFADFAGNRQYVSTGNLTRNPRVALILMDYPNQARLKILGTARTIDFNSDPELMAKLVPQDYKAKTERGFIIHVDAFDWNCPQHITPRWTAEEIQSAIAPLQQKIKELEAQLLSKK
jgi:predicted pyridoxine 5'-phosphate oxidase superfamily flavin-nucleotide-binding protein